MPESAKQRSKTMRAVKSKNTTPEITVRKTLYRLGYRYRLHASDLPGKPDIVFKGRKKAIFVHGCFWHGHSCKRGNRAPKNNSDYWRQKISKNKTRFQQQQLRLHQLGWSILIIWECELKAPSALAQQLTDFLEAHQQQSVLHQRPNARPE